MSENEGWDVLNRALKRLRTGLPVMFRRQSYRRDMNYQTDPLWHTLARVDVPDEDPAKPHDHFKYKYVAVCGYRKVFDAMFGDKPQIKDDVKTKNRRCSKCDAKLEKLKEKAEKS